MSEEQPSSEPSPAATEPGPEATEPGPAGGPYSPRVGLAVLLVSTAAMTTELVLTRIFSVVLWYHFAFFAISVALFGAGAAALLVHLLERRLARLSSSRLIGGAALALGVSVISVDLLLLNVAPNWFGPDSSSAFTELTGRLFGLFVLAAAPFFCAGFALAVAARRHAREMHRVYFWDLLGAGLACLGAVGLLELVGGPEALLAAAVFAALAALVIGRGRPLQAAALALGLGSLLLGSLGGSWLEVRVGKGIDLVRTPPEFQRWNSFSMVTVLPETRFRGWGASPNYRGPLPEQKQLVIDLNAMTPLLRFDGHSFEQVAYVNHDISALVHRLRPNSGRVCVIGAGGGKDVLAALAAGAGHVTAVEINPLIVNDVVRGQYREFTGDLYGRQDVTAVVADGRSYVRRGEAQYDVLQLSMVDTSASTAAGAYALTENSLYTVDAFEDFLAALKPGGVLTVASLSLPNLAVGARLTAVARGALLARGQDPAQGIAVVQGAWLGTPLPIYDVLVARDGFSEADVARLESAAREQGFLPVYLPGRPAPQVGNPEHAAINYVATEKNQERFEAQLATWPLDATPTSDDRPYFFYQNRLAQFVPALLAPGPGHLFGNGLVILSKVCVVALFMVGVFLLLPMLLGRRAQPAATGDAASGAGWDLAYVSCLGVGFMLVELSLLQQLSLYVGNPTLTLGLLLFSLLVMGGIGSRLFARGDAGLARRSRVLLGLLLGYGALLAFTGDALLDATRGLPGGGRAALAALLVAPLGLFLGVPFPAGLRAVAERAPARIPWLWSINSATSVLGAVLATLISLHAGVTATAICGLVLYALALGCSYRVLA